MTRFGMGPEEFAEVARLMAAVDHRRAAASPPRSGACAARFREMGYCFKGPEFDPLVQRLHELI